MLVEWFNKPCGEGEHYDVEKNGIARCALCKSVRLLATKVSSSNIEA